MAIDTHAGLEFVGSLVANIGSRFHGTPHSALLDHGLSFLVVQYGVYRTLQWQKEDPVSTT